MASVGHIAVGMAAARLWHPERAPTRASMASWSVLSLLPDVDVIGFAYGIQYGDAWGHRGATHSFALSVALGLAVGLFARSFSQRAIRTALIATIVLASHAILDTLTDGGLGCALFWPVDLARYFAPWRPIPVAPIGAAFFSSAGAMVAAVELVLFAPLFVYALGFRSVVAKPLRATLLLVVWSAMVWLIGSDDRIRERVVGFALREDTAYASGFSESAFLRVKAGHSDADVRRLLGTPHAETWLYPQNLGPAESASEMSAAAGSGACFAIRFEGGTIVSVRELDPCSSRGIKTGLPSSEVARRLGSPPERCWQYTWSPGARPFRLRAVCFTDGTVTSVIRQWN